MQNKIIKPLELVHTPVSWVETQDTSGVAIFSELGILKKKNDAWEVSKIWDVNAPNIISDNSIIRWDWNGKEVQDSKFTIDDDWNIIPTEDWTQEIGTDSLPIKDFHLKDENLLVITWRKLWGLHRDYNERASFLPFLISCDVTAWVWTCTLTDNSWSWYLAFGLDDKDLRTTWSTLSVDATAFAWTDLNPKTVYLYVQNNWTDVPELVASNTEPSDATAHVNIARYKTGTVSTSSVNIYWKIDSIVQSYEITKNVHFRAFNDWPRYQSWLLPVATSTDLTVWVWSYLLIFDKITTIQKQVSVDWLFYIKGDWTYWESTTFDFDWEYWDWVTIWNNKYFNVVIWIVEDDTTRIMWIVQDWTTEEYISFDGALADEYEQTVYYPNDDFLKNIFVPIARIIVKNTGWTYTLQQFPDWNYFKDLRGIRQAGWWGWWWTTSNVLDWNTDNDFAVWDAIDWEYKPKTIAEVKTLLDLSLYQLILAEWAFVDWDKTKLDWIDENANNYSLPISSTTVLWWVKIDWTTIIISDWVISSTTGGWWVGWSIRRLFTVAWTIWTTWTNVANTWIIDWNYTISQVNMWLWTAWSGATDLIIDVNLNWTTICSSSKPTITGTNQSSIDTWTLTTTSVSSWDILTVDIDQVQSTPWIDLYVEVVLT